MRKIFKYVIEPGFFSLNLHEGAEVLTVQRQGKEIVMWVRVQTDSPKSGYNFMLAMTGEDLGDAAQWSYKGTVQVDQFVFHLLAQ